jgi:CBS domain-containing protein
MSEVRSFMNAALVYVLEDEVCKARDVLVHFNVTSVPVLDDDGFPVGVISLRDLDREGNVLHVSRPVMTVAASEDVDVAARLVAETNLHHLVVVNESGRAVGMISAVDLLRARLHMPARPCRFDAPYTYSEESS